MARLENWILGNFLNGYQAPEKNKWMDDTFIVGSIYDDEKNRFEDGESIRTSTLINLDIENNNAQTLNTTYDLGKPAEVYVEWLKRLDITL